jgi:hypothetical protein
MLRFNREKLMVESPNGQTILSTLWHGVRLDGPLMAELAKSSTELTLRQFLNKIEEYINQEDMIGALMKGQEVEDQVKDSSKKQLLATSTQKGVKSQKKAGKKAALPFPNLEPQQRKEQRFTPLNIGVVKVFIEI